MPVWDKGKPEREKNMKNEIIDVIIPTYYPGKEFAALLECLEQQSCPVSRIIVMNTEEQFWDTRWEKEHPCLEVHHLKKENFDHGGTRRQAAELSDGDVMVFLTQDAMPADKNTVSHLVKALNSQENIGAAYARQLPNSSCSFVEAYTRSFNYPDQSGVKTKDDLPVLGIKTFFCSNVCAAYKKDIYRKLGGFVEKTIFNEDMIYAADLIHAGYGIAYAADAKVVHSHNYSCSQQFHRNFDLGVSQAQYPEIFDGVPSEGEGLRLVKKTFSYLVKHGKWYLIPGFIIQNGCKYAGYFMGKRYKKLSKKMILRCTMNQTYWNESK